MDHYGPGVTLLLMGVVAIVVIGCGAAVIWGTVTGWRDRRR